MEPVVSTVGNFSHAVYSVAGLEIDTLRPIDADVFYEYRPNSVTTKDGKVLWRYAKDRYPNAFAWLRDVEDAGFVIIYADRQYLFEVIVISDLPNMRLARDAEGREVYEGGRGAQALIELKLLLAESMQLEPKFSLLEGTIAKIIRQRQAAARAAAEATARAAAAALAEERQREQQARIQAILDRPTIYGYTMGGTRLHGIPVVGDEFRSVPSGKWVILVESYDDEARLHGPLVEHFMVKKSGGGKVSKEHPRPVMDKDPVVPQPTAVRRSQLIFEITAGAFDIISLYEQAGINALHADGLNGGAKVGLFPPNSDGTVTIFEVTQKGVRRLDRFRPVA